MIILRKRILVGTALLVMGGFFALPTVQSLYRVVHLFDADRIVENFRSADQLGATRIMTASSEQRPYPSGAAIELPDGFIFDKQMLSTEQFLADSWTTGLLVIQDDRIVYERYSLGHSESTRTISWSMAKSFISAMIGIALDEGSIASIEQPVDFYVPELQGSGYETVRIKDVLQMSSGIAFNEDYGDFNSDINRWGRGFALGSPQDKFAASLTRGREPGTLNHYVSIDTHVLSMVLSRATGKSITGYMQEKLYQPLGMEYDGYWLVDGAGKEMALGGLNLTMRDFAKLGSLYLNHGELDGKQIVPANWIAASTVADAPHLQPAEGDFGYGYQWWLPLSDDGEYMAMGVYGQYIYINPSKSMVVVKLSANPRYNDISYVPSSDFSHLAFFRSIDSRGAD
ncbi:MAG: serine hydrolase [Porticoccaceae bacterium]|jgi:CubicO group peptidase (beta-lactamase class C family)|nr:serine hydrolase [Porticoccaceae bacterium]MBT6116173.1 serine hydrolase [Porticoccaceae bacterium]MBT6593182.1 serine hydrolase [Porticoccaceae bacterium]